MSKGPTEHASAVSILLYADVNLLTLLTEREGRDQSMSRGLKTSIVTADLCFCSAHSVRGSLPCLLAILRKQTPYSTLQCTLVTQGGLRQLLQQVLWHPLLQQDAKKKSPGSGQQQA